MSDPLFANYTALLIAIIDLAHRDAARPTLCTPAQSAAYQSDAQLFLAWLRSGNGLIETAQTPLTRLTIGGRGRWAMGELDLDNRERALAWKREKERERLCL